MDAKEAKRRQYLCTIAHESIDHVEFGTNDPKTDVDLHRELWRVTDRTLNELAEGAV